jgi:hypothetical protein
MRFVKDRLQQGFIQASRSTATRLSLNLRSIQLILATLAMINLFLVWSSRNKILEGNSDFIIYYTAAQIISSNQGPDLYNLEVQKQFQNKILQTIRFRDGLLPYNHPAFEVIWFLPLGHLPYLKAFLIWAIASVLFFTLGTSILVKSCESQSQHQETNLGLILLGCLAFLPLFVTLLQGQDTGLTFLFLVLTYVNLKRSNDFSAGLWLSLVLQKFQILLPILLVLMAKKRWGTLGGFAAGAVAIFLVSVGLVGTAGVKSYLQLLVEMTGWVNRYGIYPSQMHCLRGQVYAIWFDSHPGLAIGLTILLTLLLFVPLFKAWEGKWRVQDLFFDLKFALLIVISILVSPHVNFHDLALLLLPAFLIYQFSEVENLTFGRSWLLTSTLFSMVFLIPLSTLVISNLVPIQLSVWGLLLLSGALVYRIGSFSLPSNRLEAGL